MGHRVLIVDAHSWRLIQLPVILSSGDSIFKVCREWVPLPSPLTPMLRGKFRMGKDPGREALLGAQIRRGPGVLDNKRPTSYHYGSPLAQISFPLWS